MGAYSRVSSTGKVSGTAVLNTAVRVGLTKRVTFRKDKGEMQGEKRT